MVTIRRPVTLWRVPMIKTIVHMMIRRWCLRFQSYGGGERAQVCLCITYSYATHISWLYGHDVIGSEESHWKH